MPLWGYLKATFLEGVIFTLLEIKFLMTSCESTLGIVAIV